MNKYLLSCMMVMGMAPKLWAQDNGSDIGSRAITDKVFLESRISSAITDNPNYQSSREIINPVKGHGAVKQDTFLRVLFKDNKKGVSLSVLIRNDHNGGYDEKDPVQEFTLSDSLHTNIYHVNKNGKLIQVTEKKQHNPSKKSLKIMRWDKKLSLEEQDKLRATIIELTGSDFPTVDWARPEPAPPVQESGNSSPTMIGAISNKDKQQLV